MIMLLVVCLCVAGFVCLALAMDRHQLQRWRRKPSAQRAWAFQLMGGTQLGVALWVCVSAWGVAAGWVHWQGVLTVSALCVVAGLSIHTSFQR